MKTVVTAALIGLVVISSGIRAHAQSAAEQELIKLEQEWSQAIVNRDSAALQLLYAEEFVSIDMSGGVSTKAEEITNLTSGSYRQTAFKLENLRVNIYGDVAVVIGLNTVDATFGRAAAGGQFRFTDVFVKRSGRWQCVSSQLTRILNN